MNHGIGRSNVVNMTHMPPGANQTPASTSVTGSKRLVAAPPSRQTTNSALSCGSQRRRPSQSTATTGMICTNVMNGCQNEFITKPGGGCGGTNSASRFIEPGKHCWILGVKLESGFRPDLIPRSTDRSQNALTSTERH